MSSNFFGVKTWDGPRRQRIPQNLEAATHCYESGPAGASLIDRLPNEVLQLVLSELIDCTVVLREGFDPMARCVGCLRLVSHRFKASIDCLLLTAARKPLHIHHIGGFPITRLAQMKKTYATYRTDLWVRLAPIFRNERQIRLVISFQPCMDMHEAVNWLRDDNFRTLRAITSLPSLTGDDIVATPRYLKDSLVAQRIMTAHHAAAIMTARVMQDIFHRGCRQDNEISLVLVFQEVDGTWFSTRQYFEKRHVHPEYLPCWDAQSLREILKEWQPIIRFGIQDLNNRLSVVLPNVAWPSHIWYPNDSQPYFECIETIVQAWRPPTAFDFWIQLHQNIRWRTILMPRSGYPSARRFPTNRRYTVWLTKDTLDTSTIRCHTVRGVQLSLSVDGSIFVPVRKPPPTTSSTRRPDAVVEEAEAEMREPHRAVLLKPPARDCLRRA